MMKTIFINSLIFTLIAAADISYAESTSDSFTEAGALCMDWSLCEEPHDPSLSRLTALAPLTASISQGSCPKFIIEQQILRDNKSSLTADSPDEVCSIESFVSRFKTADEFETYIQNNPFFSELNTKQGSTPFHFSSCLSQRISTPLDLGRTSLSRSTRTLPEDKQELAVAEYYYSLKRLADGAERSLDNITAIDLMMGEGGLLKDVPCRSFDAVSRGVKSQCSSIKQCSKGNSSENSILEESAKDTLLALQGIEAIEREIRKLKGPRARNLSKNRKKIQELRERQKNIQSLYPWTLGKVFQDSYNQNDYINYAKSSKEVKSQMEVQMAGLIKSQLTHTRGKLKERKEDLLKATACIKGKDSFCEELDMDKILAHTPAINHEDVFERGRRKELRKKSEEQSLSAEEKKEWRRLLTKAGSADTLFDQVDCLQEQRKAVKEVNKELSFLALDTAIVIGTMGLGTAAVAGRLALRVGGAVSKAKKLTKAKRLQNLGVFGTDASFSAPYMKEAMNICEDKINQLEETVMDEQRAEETANNEESGKKCERLTVGAKHTSDVKSCILQASLASLPITLPILGLSGLAIVKQLRSAKANSPAVSSSSVAPSSVADQAKEVKALGNEISGFSQSQVQGLGNKVEFFDPQQIEALGRKVNYLTPEQIQALGSNVRHLNRSQLRSLRSKVKHFTPRQIQDLGANLSYLTKDQLKSLGKKVRYITSGQVDGVIGFYGADLSNVFTEKQINTIAKQHPLMRPIIARHFVNRGPEANKIGDKASKVLGGKSIGVRRQAALVEAHRVGLGEKGKDGTLAGIGNYTEAQLREKNRILKDAGFTPEEIRKLMEEGVVGKKFTKEAVAALGYQKPLTQAQLQELGDSVKHLNLGQLRSLGENVKYLTKDQLQALGSKIQYMNLQDLQALGEKVQHLTPAQLKSIGVTIAVLTKDQIQALGKQLKLLEDTQIRHPDFINKLGENVKYLTKDQLQSLGKDAVKHLTGDQLRVPGVISKLGVDVKHLTDEQLRALGALAGDFTPKQLSALDYWSIQALTPDQIQALGKKLKYIKNVQLIEPNFLIRLRENVKYLTEDQLQSLGKDKVKYLTGDQLRVPGVISKLGVDVKHLTDEQLQALGALAGDFTPKQLSALGHKIKLLIKNNQIIMDSSGIRYLGVNIKHLSLDHLQALGGKVQGFTKDQIQALGRNISYLTPDQIRALGKKGIEHLTPEQVNTLENIMLVTFTPEQLKALSRKQKKGLSAWRRRNLEFELKNLK